MTTDEFLEGVGLELEDWQARLLAELEEKNPRPTLVGIERLKGPPRPLLAVLDPD